MVPYVQFYSSCVPLNTYIRFPFPDFYIFFWSYLTYCFVSIFSFSIFLSLPSMSPKFHSVFFLEKTLIWLSFLKLFSFFLLFLSWGWKPYLGLFSFVLLFSLNACVCLSSCFKEKSYFRWILDIMEKCLFILFNHFLALLCPLFL